MDCKTCTHKDLQSFSETCVECGIDMKNYKPITNADRIRSMNDEEFSHFLFGIQCAPASRPKEWLDWLKQEAE